MSNDKNQGISSERKKWREMLNKNIPFPIPELELYRLNRKSDYWRMSRRLEKICEYCLYLEAQIKELKKNNTGPIDPVILEDDDSKAPSSFHQFLRGFSSE